MKVKIIKSILSIYGAMTPGMVTTIPEHIAKNWIKNGIAVSLELKPRLKPKSRPIKRQVKKVEGVAEADTLRGDSK